MSSALRPLQKQLHELLELKDYTNIARLIESNQPLLSSTMDKGLISLLLRYAIATEDDEMMVSLVPKFTAKRDFFTVIEYNQKVEPIQKDAPSIIPLNSQKESLAVITEVNTVKIW